MYDFMSTEKTVIHRRSAIVKFTLYSFTTANYDALLAIGAVFLYTLNSRK